MMLPTAGERVFAVAAAPATPTAALADALQDVSARTGWAVLPLQDAAAVPAGCDALIGVLDGEVGLDPRMVQIWQSAQDSDLPRALIAVRSASGRADFDELVAVARRVLEPDAVVRYLPLHREDGAGYEGLYDALRAELLVDGAALPAEMEHRELTAQAAGDLVEVLAHTGLTDAALAGHLEGLPVSLPALERAWCSPAVTPVLPADDGVAAAVLAQWLAGVPAATAALVSTDGQTLDADAAGEPIGVGLAAGAARVWSLNGPADLEVVGPAGVRGTARCRGPLCTSPLIQPGDTLRRPGSRSLAALPRG